MQELYTRELTRPVFAFLGLVVVEQVHCLNAPGGMRGNHRSCLTTMSSVQRPCTVAARRRFGVDPITSLVDSLRGQIVERTKAQQQLVLIAAAVAGAALAFATEALPDRPEVMALLCLLYVGISLALLRHDQEITIMAQLLLDPDVFGEHATAQAHWERHKYVEMQAGTGALVKSGAQTAGNYGVPAVAVLATASATLASGPNLGATLILCIAGLFVVLFAIGAVDVVRRYARLGREAGRALAEQKPLADGTDSIDG